MLAWTIIPRTRRRLRGVLAFLAGALVLLLLIYPARAQPTSRSPNWSPQVKEIFERGLAAARQQRWQDAINLFLIANRAVDSDAAPIIFNLALAHDKAGGEVAAACYFNMYLYLNPAAGNSEMIRTEVDRLRREQKAKAQKVLDHAIAYVKQNGMNWLDVLELAKAAASMGETSKVQEIERRYGRHLDIGVTSSRQAQPLLPTDIWRRDQRRPYDSGCEHLSGTARLSWWAYRATPVAGDLAKNAHACEADEKSHGSNYAYCHPGGSDLEFEHVLRIAATIGRSSNHSSYIDAMASILYALNYNTGTLDGLALGARGLSAPNASNAGDLRLLDRGWGRYEEDYSRCFSVPFGRSSDARDADSFLGGTSHSCLTTVDPGQKFIRHLDAGFDVDRAIEHYDEVIRLNPGYAIAFFHRGLGYQYKGQFARAIEDFDQAIQLDPKDAFAFERRGVNYHYKGQNERAIEDFDRAIKLSPDFASAFNNRGFAYGAKGQAERAIEDFDQAIKLKYGFTDALNNRGALYYTRGEYDRALHDLDEVIRFEPNWAQALLNRGIVKKKKGDISGGDADIARARQIDPSIGR